MWRVLTPLSLTPVTLSDLSDLSDQSDNQETASHDVFDGSYWAGWRVSEKQHS